MDGGSSPFEPAARTQYNVVFQFHKSTNTLEYTIEDDGGDEPVFIFGSVDISPVNDLTNVNIYVGYPDESNYTGAYSTYDVDVLIGGISSI